MYIVVPVWLQKLLGFLRNIIKYPCRHLCAEKKMSSVTSSKSEHLLPKLVEKSIITAYQLKEICTLWLCCLMMMLSCCFACTQLQIATYYIMTTIFPTTLTINFHYQKYHIPSSSTWTFCIVSIHMFRNMLSACMCVCVRMCYLSVPIHGFQFLFYRWRWWITWTSAVIT